MKRTSTRADMVRALRALDDRTRYHADFVTGFAAGLRSAGWRSDHVDVALHRDRGTWARDQDGRIVWRPMP